MRIAERIAQRIGQLHPLAADLLAVQPLDEQIRGFLLLAGGGNRQRETRRQFGMAARGQRIPDFAGDRRLRHPGERLLVREIAGGETAIRRPRDRHRTLALQEGREVFHEAEFLDAGRHEAVLVTHVGERLHADRAVHRRLHGGGVEELAAFHAETLLEHEHRIGRFAEKRGAVNAFFLQCIGQEAANLVELLPGLRRRQVVLVFVLERLLQVGARENVLAVIEQEHVPVIGKAVDLAVDRHLVVAIRRRDLLQFVTEAVLVDVGIEHFQRAGLREVGHPRRDHVQRVVRAGARTELLHDLGEHFRGRHFDDLDLATGLFFPQRTGELGRVERLQPGFPNNGDGLAVADFLGRFDGSLGRALCAGDAGPGKC